jgi:hypothetical protein
MGRVTEKIDENRTKGDRPKVHCTKCNSETRHIVLQSVDETGSEQLDPYDAHCTIDWSNSYQIIQCQGCETISFRHLNWFSEAQDFDCDGTSEKLYPHTAKITLQCKDFLNVPPAIRRIYREVIDCFNFECVTMCAAGLRAIIEGICSENAVTKGPVERTKKDGTKVVKQETTLDGKISGLCEKGILTKKQASVLHEHRYLGNEALHRLLQPSAAELALAIEIIEHTLATLYEIPDKAEELRRSKAKRQATKGPNKHV